MLVVLWHHGFWAFFINEPSMTQLLIGFGCYIANSTMNSKRQSLPCYFHGRIYRYSAQWGPNEILKNRFLCIKQAHFKRAWYILKLLSSLYLLGSKEISFGGFQKGVVCSCSSTGCQVVLCQILRTSIYSMKKQ